MSDDKIGQFPNVEAVVPPVPDNGYKFVISLDAKLLLDLAEALNAGPIGIQRDAKVVTLKFTGEHDPVLVTCHTDNRDRGQFGIIQPCKVT